jgi:hypothetical protein
MGDTEAEIQGQISELQDEKGQIDTLILTCQNVQERERLHNQRDIKNIEIKILGLEIKILVEQDPEEKKLLREKEKQLREKEKQLRNKELEKERQLTQLMSNTTQGHTHAVSSAPKVIVHALLPNHSNSESPLHASHSPPHSQSPTKCSEPPANHQAVPPSVVSRNTPPRHLHCLVVGLTHSSLIVS